MLITLAAHGIGDDTLVTLMVMTTMVMMMMVMMARQKMMLMTVVVMMTMVSMFCRSVQTSRRMLLDDQDVDVLP